MTYNISIVQEESLRKSVKCYGVSRITYYATFELLHTRRLVGANSIQSLIYHLHYTTNIYYSEDLAPFQLIEFY